MALQPMPKSALGRVTALVAVASLAAGCANTQAYQEQVRLTEQLQLANDQLEIYLGELEAENLELRDRGEVAAAVIDEAGTTDASMATETVELEVEDPADTEIEEELARVQARIDALDTGSDAVSGVAVPGGYGFALSESLVFDSGSADLKGDGAEVLEWIVGEISGSEYAAVWVRGHSDSVPVRKAETLARFPHGNLQLSTARAVEVAAFLIDAGLPSNQVMVAGLGSTRPMADNATVEGRAQNRRVEIFVLRDAEEADASGGL
ncbi:MAG: OmpA/MotB family protein [Planctomycetota bacterium]|jgi:flagellar motor protein MotB